LKTMAPVAVSSTNRTGYLPAESGLVKVADNTLFLVRLSNCVFLLESRREKRLLHPACSDTQTKVPA
jgi:hypothetical protein